MELIGKVKVIKEEQTFASGFTKREFVITTEEQYPNDIAFELLKEKGELITKYNQGDRIKVSFDIRGREWQGKYFNSLVAWRIDNADAQAPQQAPPAYQQPQVQQSAPAPQNFAAPVDDDLPF
jgi:single-strand DNA-binding protein